MPSVGEGLGVRAGTLDPAKASGGIRFADRAAEAVARFNSGTYESVKLLVGFCLFVPRSAWESMPAAYGSLGPPPTFDDDLADPQPDPTRTSAENTELHRTLPSKPPLASTPTSNWAATIWSTRGVCGGAGSNC